ncbi:MAG: SDR family oxidoreductase [Acidobacteria bacterium]|nr:SDR family oxidoreductase [Acidobacteriota bacterium]
MNPWSNPPAPQGKANPPVFWRVEGSLLHLSAVRPIAFFTWNAQSFSERWARRGGLGLLALVRPFLYAVNRVAATRVLHTSLRGVSQDRLDLLGEEYFHYILKPRLRPRGVEKLQEWMSAHGQVVLVSQGLDHVMRPLAEYLGVTRLVANRLEFRDGLATGRLLNPVIPPRGALARLIGRRADGRVSQQWLCRELDIPGRPEILHSAIFPAQRSQPRRSRTLVVFDAKKQIARLPVRESLTGKHILLIGVTGFIGKVWLIHLLSDLPEVGRIYLLIRRQGPHTALRRFEKIVAESPAFDELYERHGERLAQFLSERIEVVEGDVCKPGLGLEPGIQARLRQKLDVIVNSSGLTDFNPDLREALATNVDAVVHLLDFLRQSDHATLMHLSTCYAAGARDGRVSEELTPNYTPARNAPFDAEREWQALHELVSNTEAQSQSPAVTEELRRLVIGKSVHGKSLSTSALENHIARHRSRWLRTQLTQAGIQRARQFGWPNTYTFSKSLAESLIASRGLDLPVAVVRPSIVETSLQQPFRGWNEGVNTSAPLSYLLGTYFRQLPSNERKCLDVIPVDLVCRGMTLIAVALVNRRHERVYQLATSAVNPCDMRRSIELTGLAHRKHYRAQESFRHRLRLRFDTISVSKERYQNFSAPRQKAIIRALQRTMQPLPFLQSPLARTERNLDRVEKIIELYEPFILQNDHVFEAENVELLSLALPPEEKETFGYDAISIDWWDYWINVHIPAQRKWSYPLIEGRPLEARPERPFRLLTPDSPAPAAGETLQSQARTSTATWPSS